MRRVLDVFDAERGPAAADVEPREIVPITLPASISDGVPVAGAGRLDTFASEDVYSFSNAAVGNVQFNFSQCQPMLTWQLVNVATAAEVTSVRNTCSGTLVSNLATGSYQLVVTPSTGTGTYQLDAFKP